jgi:hypothetical protein
MSLCCVCHSLVFLIENCQENGNYQKNDLTVMSHDGEPVAGLRFSS